MDVMDRLNVRSEYQIINEAIRDEMRRSASSAVRLGHLLRQMMDGRLWAGHYDSLDGYLRAELHMDYTMACRFEAINRKYSVNGRSADIDEKWEDYSQGVLIEMLNMPPELEAKVTPDMTVRQVREIKRQAKREKPKEKRGSVMVEPVMESMPAEGSTEPEISSVQDDIPDAEYRELEPAEEVATSQLPEMSAYGLEKTVYPEGSLLSGAGCGGLHDCFSCAQDCGMRQEYRYCRYAPLGNPFECATMKNLNDIREDMGERCQFIDNALARHTAGTDEAAPCCLDCNEECKYRCRRSCRERDAALQEADAGGESGMEQDSRIMDDLAEVKRILEKEQKMLNDFLEAGAEDKEVLESQMFKRQSIIVAALAAMARSMEKAEPEPEPEEVKQSPLPILKNNDQRKEWLKSYKDWGLWYRDDNIGVDYYKYSFDNGAQLIAEVYQEEATKYYDAYESVHLHLVGGPKPPADKHGIHRWQWHGKYNRYPNNETELIEFLKEIQKKG